MKSDSSRRSAPKKRASSSVSVSASTPTTRSGGTGLSVTKTVARLISGARSRAKVKGIPFALTKADIFLPAACPVLGIPLELGQGRATDNSPTLDRVVPSMGYVPGNVLVISMRANRIKSDAATWELRRVADFYENHITEAWMRPKEKP